MKKFGKVLSLALGTCMAVGLVGVAAACEDKPDSGKGGATTTLVVWCPEADHEFAKQVAADFQAAHPNKKYKFQFGIQGENDAATKVLNDVENAPDVFSFASDQINKLIVGDALARIGGDRLQWIKDNNTAEAVDSATVSVQGEDRVYAFPYTDNTFFLYYDKSQLTEADIATLDGIMEKTTAEKQFYFPLADAWYNSSFYFGAGLDYEVTLDPVTLAETKVTTDFGGEKGVAVPEALWGYVQQAGFKADSDDSKIIAGFQSGIAIAGVSGIWNKKQIEQYLGPNMGVAKLPTYTLNGEQVQLKAFAGYKLLGVSKRSPNMADALEFAQFYTNKENQLKHFDARGFVPCNTQAKIDSKVTADACAQAISAQLVYTHSQKNVPGDFWTPMGGLGTAMLNAIKDPSSFDLQKELKAAVDGFKKG